jgi:ankyrin repeat protein
MRSAAMLLLLLCLLCLSRGGAAAEGGSDLFPAIKEGNLPGVQDLLARDRRLVNKPDSLAITPLHMAAFWGQKPIASLLIEQGARVEVQDGNGRTPLDVAMMQGDREMVRLLLRAAHDAKGGRRVPERMESVEGVVAGIVDGTDGKEILVGGHVFRIEATTDFRPSTWRPECKSRVRIWYRKDRAASAVTIESK